MIFLTLCVATFQKKDIVYVAWDLQALMQVRQVLSVSICFDPICDGAREDWANLYLQSWGPLFTCLGFTRPTHDLISKNGEC